MEMKILSGLFCQKSNEISNFQILNDTNIDYFQISNNINLD